MGEWKVRREQEDKDRDVDVEADVDRCDNLGRWKCRKRAVLGIVDREEAERAVKMKEGVKGGHEGRGEGGRDK